MLRPSRLIVPALTSLALAAALMTLAPADQTPAVNRRGGHAGYLFTYFTGTPGTGTITCSGEGRTTSSPALTYR